MAFVNSSCTVKTSFAVLSYESLHRCLPSVVLVNDAVTRSRSPLRRTVPSTIPATSSALPMSCAFADLPLNENDDVRAASRSPGSWDSACASSSVMPSEKYSSFASPPVFTNGNTAMVDIVLESPVIAVDLKRRATNTAPIASNAAIAMPPATAVRRRDVVKGVEVLVVTTLLSASMSSFADDGRLSGFFASARITRLAAGVDAESGAGISAMCAATSCCAVVFPANGCIRDSSSYARYVLENRDCSGRRNRTPIHACPQAFSLDKRHRVPRQPINLARRDDGNDVRLLQAGRETNLAFEALAAQPFGKLG